jgi:3-oxoacyl-[acyl-carrier-protein] synthase II
MTVLITGLGLISPYGIGTDALMRGVSSGPLARMLCTAEGWPWSVPEPTACLKVAQRDVENVLGGERHRFLNSESSLLLAAARLALADAEHPHEAIEGTGIVVSTRHAGLQDYAELFWSALGEDATAERLTRTKRATIRPRVSPVRGPQTGLNAPAAQLSIRLGARGPNMTLTNGAAGGIDALAYAAGALETGRASAMLVGGVEVIPRVIHGHSPAGGRGRWRPSGPFDRHRTGPLLGEAGVVAVLERDASARRRGARACARVRAATSAFAPDGDLENACRRSLTSALSMCSLSAQQVGGVFAGANGSVAGDAAESRALYAVFGDRTPVCAVKGATADSMGAAALVQLAVALASMRRRSIPATAGFRSRGADVAPIRVLLAPEPLSDAPVVIHAWDAMSCAASAVLDGSDAPTLSAHSRSGPHGA